ncbi:MAG: FlgD immunoglobulin-like domain containing protein, partial [Campylobacterota bacterium]|nr:FlgD immunoglobulin-like domain containing protein [Campylobacterota bacterium]
LVTNISGGDVFAPYLGPLLIEFNITEASEVSLDIGPDGYTVTERIKTLLLKKPLGKGFYRFKWAGDANDGTLADLSQYKEKYPSSANYYMTGGFSNKLAENAVYVKSGVSVSNLHSDAPIYIPNAKEGKKLSISFDLSTDASVTLSINDAKSGATVMIKQYASLTEGSQIVEWDGKDEDGKYIAPGVYRIGIKATDSYGYTSLTQYALQRIFY